MGIGLDFIIGTRYEKEIQTDEMAGVPSPPIEDDFDGEIIDLPDPDCEEISSLDISVAIESRESIRSYLDMPMSISELSYLLWCTQGVKWIFEDCTFRTVPSAGARHPIDTYLVINNVSSLKPGLYRYLALKHGLGLIREDNYLKDLVFRASVNQKWVKDAAVCFIWVADSYRITWRYGERGFRDLILEAGHICQNLYLSAQSVNCGVCAIGAFIDEELNDLLDLDGAEKFVIYMATVGKKNQESDEDL